MLGSLEVLEDSDCIQRTLLGIGADELANLTLERDRAINCGCESRHLHIYLGCEMRFHFKHAQPLSSAFECISIIIGQSNELFNNRMAMCDYRFTLHCDWWLSYHEGLG